MSRIRIMTGAAIAASVCCSHPVLAATSALTSTLAGNVARWVPAAPASGTAAATTSVHIAVHMALRDPDGLRDFVAAVSTPGNPSYGRYLTPDQFAARYAPAETDLAAVRAMLTTAGMTGVSVGGHGAYVAATATVAQIRQAFGVTQKLYEHRGRLIRANAEAPTIPAALAGKILYIEGLDATDTLRQPFHVSAMQGAPVIPAAASARASVLAATATAGVTPPPVASYDPSPACSSYFGDHSATLATRPAPYDRTLPWLNCGYTPQQIQAAYGLNPFDVGIDGRGVTVAIVDAYASPTLRDDENRYAARHGLPALRPANFSEIIPDGIYDVPSSELSNAYGWWTEESLDVAAVHGSAPGATIVYVGSESNDSTLTEALLDTIYAHRADIITNSYGDNGEPGSLAEVAGEDQSFQAAAAMGITVLFSSGDDGDLSQNNGEATGSYEATSPYVTGVGGTSLLLTSRSGRKTEYGWGTYRGFLANANVDSTTSIATTGLQQTQVDGLSLNAFGFYSGSGGGISAIEPQPAYQAGVVPTGLATTLNQLGGPATVVAPMRVSPDIAADADPYTGYLYPETYTIAGSYSDNGCTRLSATTEYCEISEGGTSLASPLMAGVMATVNQVHGLTGRPMVGFANPWLYKLRIGRDTNRAGINQIRPPSHPTAVLRGYVSDPTEVRVVTVNSVSTLIQTSPSPLEVCGQAVCEGLDDVFNKVTPGYNDVTGLGVPYVPFLALE